MPLRGHRSQPPSDLRDVYDDPVLLSVDCRVGVQDAGAASSDRHRPPNGSF
jgi:hypothetical protein